MKPEAELAKGPKSAWREPIPNARRFSSAPIPIGDFDMTDPSNQEILREVTKLRESTNRLRTELKGELATIQSTLDAMKDDTKATKKNTNLIHDNLAKLSEGMNIALSFIKHLPDSKIELKIRK